MRWGAHKQCSNCQMVPEIGRESDGSHVFVDYSHLFVDRTTSGVPERLVHIAALQLCADKRHYVKLTSPRPQRPSGKLTPIPGQIRGYRR